MKRIFTLTAIVCCLISAQSCQSDEEVIANLVKNMVYVQGGVFEMGTDDDDAYDCEKPAHLVTLSDYYIGKFEVTQREWQAVMGDNPSLEKENDKPVSFVSRNDCQEFIAKLNQKTGKTFCLPTISQWEYAAKGGSQSKGYAYSGSNTLEDVAWCLSNSKVTVQPIGAKKANELGLYDMSGNVNEWCSDWYGHYFRDPQNDPIGLTTGSAGTFRGGSFFDSADARDLRTTHRNGYQPPEYSTFNLGFRLAMLP